MTLVVGILCTDGVVIGADSAVTLGPLPAPTVSQPFPKKIEIIEESVVVTGSGHVGTGQRFVDVVSRCWGEPAFRGLDALDMGRTLTQNAWRDFSSTGIRQSPYGALVAVPSGGKAKLIEFEDPAFQAELKTEEGLWYTSMGSGQSVADPLLGFIRATFWESNAPPSHQEGIFAATMVLKLGCGMAPAYVSEPIYMAVLAPDPGNGGTLSARWLSKDQLSEHEQSVQEAIEHFRGYRDILRGKDAQAIAPLPTPPSPPPP